MGKLDRNKAYLVHCRSGGRSTNSLGVWKKLGFKRVYHLDGGFLAWQKAKLPVEK
ncbi:MAG: rhodanese-like domain-containing protein [Roseibacillus sp.]